MLVSDRTSGASMVWITPWAMVTRNRSLLSHFLDGEVLAVHRDGLLLGLILVSGLHVDGLAAGAVVVHIVDIQVHVVVLLVVVLGGLADRC